MKTITRFSRFFLFCFSFTLFLSCIRPSGTTQHSDKLRGLVDTVGFAHESWQMDRLMQRIHLYEGDSLLRWQEKNFNWRVCISPHDDYTYVGYLYPAVLSHVHAPLVILFGVAHKARLLGLQDKLVTGTFSQYRGPRGNIAVSPLREEIMAGIDTSFYTVNDSMMRIEHSLEALLPFLQYDNRNLQIIPVLVPYMSFDRMQEISTALARSVRRVTEKHDLTWGTGYAIVISTDAVHYGDEDWGGKNFAFYGTDSAGLAKAVAHEHEIMDSTLVGPLSPGRIKKFTRYTVQENDYKTYKWTWCGRYSVPFGLLAAWHLQQLTGTKPLSGELVGYRNSIDHKPIPVDDLHMGVTAPANIHHWVGYAAIGYR
ncbi:MAG: AmmeMemoRadiSam system protein B [Bacteroidales bacterium]|nr:AmmeMemoRadiSam system protein B [Bacteroidales bacterium]